MRLKEQKKSIKSDQSEHLLRLIALFKKGEEIFGNVNEFNSWLQQPFRNASEKPVNWLVTPEGVELVSEELDRLAHVYVV